MTIKTKLTLATFLVAIATVLANDSCVMTGRNGCPTITATASIASLCPALPCFWLPISTIANPCGCPSSAPTVTLDYGRNCPPATCPTSYVVGKQSKCPPVTVIPASSTTSVRPLLITDPPQPTIVLPDKCTFRPTQTILATSGCSIKCNSMPACIADAAVTVPCGCPSVVVKPTTKTICPTSTSCFQCSTGWGFFTISQCPPTATFATLPTALRSV